MTEIPVPAQPAMVDECNMPGEGDNAYWVVPSDTDLIDWEVVNGELIATAKDGYVFEGDRDSINFGVAVDSGELCYVPTEGPVPAQPQHLDPCNTVVGEQNSFWVVPENSVELSWALLDRALCVYTNDGYVFPGGETTYSFGNSPESGTYCMPGTA